jgi:hypothetical protein
MLAERFEDGEKQKIKGLIKCEKVQGKALKQQARD